MPKAVSKVSVGSSPLTLSEQDAADLTALSFARAFSSIGSPKNTDSKDAHAAARDVHVHHPSIDSSALPRSSVAEVASCAPMVVANSEGHMEVCFLFASSVLGSLYKWRFVLTHTRFPVSPDGIRPRSKHELITKCGLGGGW